MFCLVANRLTPAARQGAYLIPRLGIISRPSSQISLRDLLKPALFACGFTGTAFAVSAIATYEGYKRRSNNAVQRFWKKQKDTLSDGQLVAAAITAVNVAVFACFKVKGLQRIMNKYFILSAGKGGPLCLPLILSTFSHIDVWHLGINMFVLFSFAQTGVAVLGKEQFLALYTSAGVFASLVSLAHKVVTKTTVASVGASGAILAVFALHCLLFPDSRIQIVFLPFLGTSAGYALPGLLTLDAAGLLLKWQRFDHAAHLAGASCGIFYYLQGQNLYQQYGTAVARSWQRLTSR